MNPKDLKAFIDQVSREKELDVAAVKDAIEQAIISASKKNLSLFNEARVDLDVRTGELHLFVLKTVVTGLPSNPRTEISVRDAAKIGHKVPAGEMVEVEIDPAAFGRIAAQSARQVVMQKLKDAERAKAFGEFEGKVHEVLSGIVQRFEKRDLILTIGKAEALLPRTETPPTSHYRIGDRIKVYVTEVDIEAKGPIVKVSRTNPELVAKLFEQEVPEIADNTVKVVSVARDPGARTKIAVDSNNSDVDPVGACVGVKGSRVQMIVRELENEKIDIVPFNPNPRLFITSALVPAQVQSVSLDEEQKKATVTVKKGNLSLAIGKRGQNARLAANLTGWKLEIHSEAEEPKVAPSESENVRKYLEDFLSQVDGWPDHLTEALVASPYNSVAALADADYDELVAVLEGDQDLASTLITDARAFEESYQEMIESYREMTQTQYGDESKAAGEPEEGEAQPEPAGNPAEDESAEKPE